MLKPDILETPEWALQVFEKLTGLQVVVHDLSSDISPFLQPERFRHRSSCCMAIKARHDWACMDFEMTRLRQDILKIPDGRYHVCHAGFMEWVLPVFIGERLALILFAGQAKASGSYDHLTRDRRRTDSSLSTDPALPEIKEDQAQAILESLRHLRSRLLEWHREASSVLHTKGDRLPVSPDRLADRKFQIQRFLHQNHTGPCRLRDLARLLNLGESRCSHLVKELFGTGYVQLLNNMRLRTSSSLLRKSSLSIMEVCLHSGFQDLSHFHRCFQKRFGTTPFKYRQLSQT